MSYKNDIRRLDIDDFIIMSKFSEGKIPAMIAREMWISVSAISHRTKKIKSIFGDDIFDGIGIKKKATEKGKILFAKCKDIILTIESWDQDDKI